MHEQSGAEIIFNTYDDLTDGEIDLVLKRTEPAEPGRAWAPAYRFDIVLHGGREAVGSISLRLGDTDHLRLYAGHIGYGVRAPHRGHRYAAKACMLFRRVALDHGMRELWITCNPDNYPSRRTCEIVGAEYVETVDLPPDSDMYRMGERRKRRYRWRLDS